jgi:hypothetical protein
MGRDGGGVGAQREVRGERGEDPHPERSDESASSGHLRPVIHLLGTVPLVALVEAGAVDPLS